MYGGGGGDGEFEGSGLLRCEMTEVFSSVERRRFLGVISPDATLALDEVELDSAGNGCCCGGVGSGGDCDAAEQGSFASAASGPRPADSF